MKTAVAAPEEPSRPLRVLELEDAIRRAAEAIRRQLDQGPHVEIGGGEVLALEILEEVLTA